MQKQTPSNPLLQRDSRQMWHIQKIQKHSYLQKNWWASTYKSWNTFTTDLAEAADFMENAGIIECLVSAQATSKNPNISNASITTRH